MSKNWFLFCIMLFGLSSAEDYSNVMYGCCINSVLVIPCNSSMVKKFMCVGAGFSLANDCFGAGLKVFCVLKKSLLLSISASKSWKDSKSVTGFGCGFSFKFGIK